MPLRGVLVVALALWPAGLAGQGGLVAGEVRSEGSPVSHARVEVRGGSAGTFTDGAGAFRLRLPAGEHVLRAWAAGRGAGEAAVTVEAGGVSRVVLELTPRALELDPLVVTGTRKAVFVSESPVKVDVVTGRYLQRRATSNLMESVGLVNGLYQQVDCAVCYTNNIRVNGMEGPYTAVLIDGMPIMSALASVYGLNGINPSLVERLEVVKGPASTLYGTEAMGGVVNVITKDPRFAPRLSVDGRRTSIGRTTLDVAGAPSRGDLSALVSGTAVHMDRFVDRQGDGFSDVPLETRVALFGRADWSPGGRTLASVSAKLYRDDRFGGVREWTEADRGSDRVYGEKVLTDRVELLGSWTPTSRLRAEGSYSRHHQDSWYGAESYRGRQAVTYGALIYDFAGSRGHDPLLGITFRHHAYDDDTPAATSAERRLVPGVFVQNELRLTPDVRLLGGLRLDHHEAHGAILSPRLSGKWQARARTALRLNAGTGFRVVHLFTEDHAALTGAREVVIAGALSPERSYSVAGNLNHSLDLLSGEAMVDVDLFYTHFTNRIVPDYDTDPRLIIYANLDGYAVSRGISVAWNHVLLEPALSYDIGVTVQDVHVVDGGERRLQLFSPRFTGVLSVGWAATPRLSVDYTAQLTGPMRLPEYPEPFARPTRSPAHHAHDVQAAYALPGGVELYGGVRNIFDFTQGSPLVDAANPFSDHFDTTYVWGPLLGRELVMGARLGVGR